MPLLIIDACAALHAKQTQREAVGPLSVLTALVAGGVTIGLTPGVQGEQVQMSFSTTLKLWSDQGRLLVGKTTSRERQAVKGSIGTRKDEQNRMPGDNDVALIAFAQREGAVLLTHDNAAQRLARRCAVTTVDLLDLADLVGSAGWTPCSDLESGFDTFNTFAWKPDDWRGGLAATLAARPGRAEMQRRLRLWLDGEHV